MIVALKVEGETAVSTEEGRAFAAENGCLFATTSSKLGDGVIRSFQELSSHVLAHEEVKDEKREGLWLNAVPMAESTPKKKGCC